MCGPVLLQDKDQDEMKRHANTWAKKKRRREGLAREKDRERTRDERKRR